MRTRIMREGSTLIEIASYSPGDGALGFVARNINTSAAMPPAPTLGEADRACPDGWYVVDECGIPRAYKRDMK